MKRVTCPAALTSSFLAVALLAFGVGSASAAPLTLNLNVPFGPNNGSPATGTTGTLTVSTVTANEVLVTLTTAGGANEYISGFDFNLNPAKNPTSASLSNFASSVNLDGAVTLSSFVDSAPTQVDESGLYNLSLNFAGTGGTGSFAVGDTITFDITDSSGITPGDFDFSSAPNPAGLPFNQDGQYLAALDAHAPSNSSYSWIGAAVPDGGSTVALLGLTLLALCLGRRRFCAA